MENPTPDKNCTRRSVTGQGAEISIRRRTGVVCCPVLANPSTITPTGGKSIEGDEIQPATEPIPSIEDALHRHS
jgi:hypothetical protein